MKPLQQKFDPPTSNLSGPFSQPSPASARGGCLIEIAGSSFGKEVMAQMVWEAKKLIDI